MTQIENTWRYGQVKSNALNVRREPSRKARRWNNVWPMNRLVLVKSCSVDGWYETLYRGEPAYVMAEFIKLLDEPVPENTVERMMFMAEPEKGRSKSIYFNGYGGKWCHRFADWLAMNAGMSKEMIPNTSNCGKGIVWFAINPNSGGFYFKSAEHKARMICAYSALDGLPYELTEEEQTYVPQPGDYVYFRWENVENRVNVSHVGVVAVATQEYIITWEGNASKKVTQRTCFELFCQGCFHIFLQHAGVGNSRNCIPRHMVAHHRFHPAYTQKAEAVDVTSTASACFLINPAAEKLRCCRSCCHGQSRF